MTAAEAFSLIQQNRIVALLRLDLPTVLALPLYYLVFLGLFAVLHQDDLSYTTLATTLAFVGVTLLLATPMGLSMVPLSDRYTAATSEEARSQLLGAGEAILAADMWHATGAFVGSLLLQAGAVLVSVAMLRASDFGDETHQVGFEHERRRPQTLMQLLFRHCALALRQEQQEQLKPNGARETPLARCAAAVGSLHRGRTDRLEPPFVRRRLRHSSNVAV